MAMFGTIELEMIPVPPSSRHVSRKCDEWIHGAIREMPKIFPGLCLDPKVRWLTMVNLLK